MHDFHMMHCFTLPTPDAADRVSLIYFEAVRSDVETVCHSPLFMQIHDPCGSIRERLPLDYEWVVHTILLSNG